MKFLKKYSGYSTLPLRVALGLIFIHQGYGSLSISGIPLVLGVLNFSLGISLLIGLFTRWASLLLALIIIGSVIVNQQALSIEIVLIAALTSLILSGPGKLSVETMLFKKEF